MNDPRPTEAGREDSPGGTTPSVAHVDDDLRDLRWNIRGRLHACLNETAPYTGIEWESVEVILEGALEEIRAATT